MHLQTIKILIKHFKTSYINAILSCLILTSGIISCYCSPTKNTGEEELTMEVEPSSLVGDQKNIHVTFKLSEEAEIAHLEKYTLKANFTDTENGDLKISYYDTQKKQHTASTIDQKLSDFVANQQLTKQDPSCTLTFTLQIKPGITHVTIKFELLDETGKLVKDGIATWRNKGNDKTVDLQLERIGKAVLRGSQREFEFKITNKGTQETHANQLILKITRVKGDSANISESIKQEDGTYLISLPETIEGRGGDITKKLTVEMGTDMEAAFNFELLYEGKKQNQKFNLICKKGDLDVEAISTRFIGDYVAELIIMNAGESDISTDGLNLEIVSDNEATFQFITDCKTTGSSSIDLDKFHHEIIEKNGGFFIRVRINNPNNQAKALIVVKLKKGIQEIATSEEIVWEAHGVQLKLNIKNTIEEYIFQDNAVGNLQLSNVGNIPISIQNINVVLTNDAGLRFKLGDIIGDNIHASLESVLGKSVMLNKGDAAIDFSLQIASNATTVDEYGANLKLELLDKNNNLLIERKLAWMNSAKVNKLLNIPQIMGMSKKIDDVRHDPKLDMMDSHSGPEFNFDAVQQDPTRITNFAERTISTFKLRKEAEDTVPLIVDAKNKLKIILNQDSKKMPDFVKNIIQSVIDSADDSLIQKIDQDLIKDFECVTKISSKILNDINRSVGQYNDKIRAQKDMETLKQWVAIADRFATEIGTRDAKELASNVNAYKTEAENSLK